MKKTYEMTQDRYNALMREWSTAEMIPVKCNGLTVHVRSDYAWEKLGNEMGFKFKTIEPSDKGHLFFTAEPK